MSDTPGHGQPVPIDRSALAEISDGDQAVERRMLTVFRQANDADAAALKEALGQQDIAAVTRASHRIKGASMMVGATSLAVICARIEQAGRAGDWGASAAERSALYGELDRVNAYLDTLRITQSP